MNLDALNSIQREAVEYFDSALLIFAGAGSGKTRVLTHKIAYLIKEKGVSPGAIMGVTFTNKAATEMRERVNALLHGDEGMSTLAGDISSGNSLGRSSSRNRTNRPVTGSAFKLWGNTAVSQVGTFHSICARLLRAEIHRLGYPPSFVIYDSDDQLRLIKAVLGQLELDPDQYAPALLQARISKAKNQLQTVDDIAAQAEAKTAPWSHPPGEILAAVYREYQLALNKNHALDFDDLLMLPLTLFRQFPRVLERYQNKFEYILVDEYQDTNRAQFDFVRQLAAKHQRICVVGDDDQSIYSWRGADITNILNFAQVFDNARIFKLEQNYRSTATILTAAGAVVANNQHRTPKKLWTERKGGAPLYLYPAYDERDEADHILELIQHEILSEKRRFRDMAILYRTNAQSRALEDALRRRGISYVIVGGIKFYDRKEVKDVLAYLRLVINPRDAISLERILNFPPRAIGGTSLNRLRALARQRDMPLYTALDHALEAGVQPRQAQAMRAFKTLLDRYQELFGISPPQDRRRNPANDSKNGLETTGYSAELSSDQPLSTGELVRALLEETGVFQYYRRREETNAPDNMEARQGISYSRSALQPSGSRADSRERLDNIDELLASIDEFCRLQTGATLTDFLQEVALLADIDSWNENTNVVTLMTLHSAKGLEFPIIYMTGLEEGLFPFERADSDGSEDEEERRLFYVGLTRARDKAYLSYAIHRRRWGGRAEGAMSRFLRELPPELVVWQPNRYQGAAGSAKGVPGDGRQIQTAAIGKPPVESPFPGGPGAGFSPRRGIYRRNPYQPPTGTDTTAILDDLVTGAFVEHQLFGKGQIIDREGVGDNLKLTVRFGDDRLRKLVARYSNLTRL